MPRIAAPHVLPLPLPLCRRLVAILSSLSLSCCCRHPLVSVPIAPLACIQGVALLVFNGKLVYQPENFGIIYNFHSLPDILVTCISNLTSISAMWTRRLAWQNILPDCRNCIMNYRIFLINVDPTMKHEWLDTLIGLMFVGGLAPQIC